MTSITLRPMPMEALTAWRASAEAHYRSERIAAGDSPQYAEERVQQSRQYFPAGRPSPGQLVFEVWDAEQRVGTLWLGVLEPRRPTQWWVMDIQIDESQRGRGVGRAAMLLAEREARDRGGDSLALSVFGPNLIARRLYDSLGYQVVATNMAKPLRQDARSRVSPAAATTRASTATTSRARRPTQ